MRRNKSIRSMVIDFVEANGPQPYKALKKAMLTIAGQPLNRNEYGSSFLDQVSRNSACFPNSKDNRFLMKESDGLYHIHHV